MSNFQIHFTYPWLLLLLIPALFFSFLPYFKIAKRYRRNRNRVTSVVLHSLALVLLIFSFSGLHFSYEEPNPKNEIILLVDTSYSSDRTKEEKDAFVKAVLDESDGTVKVGVVKFAYDQVYAAEMNYNAKKVYEEYLNSAPTNGTATNIEAALTYTQDLFNYPETAKIILMTDGVETDGNALSVIKAIASEGTRVDVMHFPAAKASSEMQLVGVEMPKSRIEPGKSFEIGITIQSSYEDKATVTLYDNDEKVAEITPDVIATTKTYSIQHTFPAEEKGLHQLRFELSSSSDKETNNNIYYSFINLQNFTKILVLESVAGESEEFQKILMEREVENEEDAYKIDAISIKNMQLVPSTIRGLRAYDQVILFNVSNADLPVFDDGVRFDELLQEYVRDYGGGMFTVGGNKEETDEDGNPVANTYVREDMYRSIYQEMLPVEAVNYTPPLGVMIVIDWSGSMNHVDEASGKKYLTLAQEGARSAIEALTERDYCGVISLQDSYKKESKPIPLTEKAKLFTAIANLGSESSGGTIYRGAIEHAGSTLRTLSTVERKHIILISDGEPADAFAEYKTAIEANIASDITMSLMIVGEGGQRKDMEAAASLGGGRCYFTRMANISDTLRQELKMDEIKGVTHEDFSPIIDDTTAVLKGISQPDLDAITLGGFYGTKLKPGAAQPLRGEFVPIYAQWEYGKGKVGSFMCELTGSEGAWSEKFMQSPTGKLFINNVISELFPLTDVKAQAVEAVLKENNYSTQVNLYPEKSEATDKFEVTVSNQSNSATEDQKIETTAMEVSKKLNFTLMDAGVYKIYVRQITEAGEEQTATVYKAFSYSKEYDAFFDAEACMEMLTKLTSQGKGAIMKGVDDAYAGVEKMHTQTYNPALIFWIIALVAFLLDIAVRKFKFKWPHEIIRARKERKLLQKK